MNIDASSLKAREGREFEMWSQFRAALEGKQVRESIVTGWMAIMAEGIPKLETASGEAMIAELKAAARALDAAGKEAPKINISKGTLDWLLERGQHHYRRKDYRPASGIFCVLCALCPTVPHYWHSFGLAEQAVHEWHSATFAHEQAVKLETEQANYWLQLAECYDETHQLKAAKQALDKAEGILKARPDEALASFAARLSDRIGHRP
ncbi:MAG: hypothetical protein KDK78_08385 [Chlamydiia bacterium]|nr:hypothetical protein [Chlamydiia bacterium]